MQSSARVNYFWRRDDFLEDLKKTSKNATLSLMKEIKKFSYLKRATRSFIWLRRKTLASKCLRGEEAANNIEKIHVQSSMNSRESELYVSKWVHFCVCRATKEFFSHVARRISRGKSWWKFERFGKFLQGFKTFLKHTNGELFWNKNRYEEVQWTTAEESFNRHWPYVLVTLLACSSLYFPRTFRLCHQDEWKWPQNSVNIFTNAYNQLYAHTERCVGTQHPKKIFKLKVVMRSLIL